MNLEITVVHAIWSEMYVQNIFLENSFTGIISEYR
jgi:hypothetical protein